MTKNVPTKNLLDAFPECFEGEGIFSEMTNLPWAQTVSADLLDMDYFGNHSGWKKCSPLVYKLFNDNFELSDANRLKLANLITAKFLPNWTALWNSYHFQYDPITDYDVTEEGEREAAFQKSRAFSHSGTRDDTTTVTMTHGHTISETGSTEVDEDTTLTHGEEIATTDETDVDEQARRYGFNSSTAVPTDEREAHSESTGSTIHSGADVTAKEGTVDETKTTTHGGADTNRVVLDGADTASDTTQDAGSDTDEYTKRFSGLKGYTSRQELIERERALWQDSFFDKVYSDVDSVLASLIYKREHRVSPYSMFPFGYYSI